MPLPTVAVIALTLASIGFVACIGMARLLRRYAYGRARVVQIGCFAGVLFVWAALGVASGSARWSGWHAAQAQLPTPNESTADAQTPNTAVVAIRDPTQGRFGWVTTVRPLEGAPVRFRVMLPPGQDPPVRLGEVFALKQRVMPIDPSQEWARRAHRRFEAGSVPVRAVEIEGWASTPSGWAGPIRATVNEMVAKVPGARGDVLQGVLLGDRTRMSGTVTEEDMRVCGLSHLIAVSGTHLSIVGMLLGRVLGHARQGLVTRAAVVVAAMGMYVVLTGVQPSALRALGMGAVAGLAAVSGRRGDGLAALAAAVAVMLMADPVVAFDIGFRLSVCAVAGIVVFGGLAGEWIRSAFGTGRVHRWAEGAADMLALTLVAQVATLPVALPAFGMFSLIAPLANVIAMPLVTVGLIVGLVAAVAGLVLSVVAGPFMSLAALPLGLVTTLARHFASIPGAALGVEAPPGPLVATVTVATCALWVAWPRPRDSTAPRMALGLVVALTVWGMIGAPTPSGEPRIRVLDVGQGDAVIVTDDNATLLIDTGPDPDVLRTALTRAGIRRIDALVFTHDHADHTGGAPGLVGVVRVGRAFAPSVADPEAFAQLIPHLDRVVDYRKDEGSLLGSIAAGDVLTVGLTRLEALWPRGPDPALATNDTSVILHLTRGEFSAILPGDAEEVVWDRLARDEMIPDIDVLLVPHHGSSNGITATALDTLRPAVALISAGAGNEFGHPSRSVIDLLEDREIAVFRTDIHGELRVSHDLDGRFAVFTTRGAREAACATISGGIARTLTEPGDHDRPSTCRPQTRLPHLRTRGAAAYAGGRALEAKAGGRRGSRLQLDGARWGSDRRRLGHHGLQHVAVHVRAPPGDCAQG
ncbi:MAG: DNA internalization-related competence protein ComEC/Rec2 [Clostridiales bacterium]|nr:DNA internalization-related competence protein ComEC/Rec2 [Clostridiales bacterium]